MFRGRSGGRYSRGGGSATRGSRNNNNNNPFQTSNRAKGLFADGIWQCDCDPRLPAEHFKVKKEGKNQGRWFYTCQQTQDSGKRCGFFLWDEDAKPRMEAAVLGNSRTEPAGKRESAGVQEGWDAGRSAMTTATPSGKGLFARSAGQVRAMREDDAETASPTPSPAPPQYNPASVHGIKRNARDAGMDVEDEFDQPGWSLSQEEEEALVKAADAAAPQTPHKVQKMGVYATPATEAASARRKLPWLEEPVTPATTSKTSRVLFDPPAKPPAEQDSEQTLVPDADELPHTPTTAHSHPVAQTARTPSPPSRHKDALLNPADRASSLTSEALAALSSSIRLVPPDSISALRSILTKHDLKTQGIIKGRDISRLALKAKDAKITELHARIASLQAEREMDKGVMRSLRWEVETARRSNGSGDFLVNGSGLDEEEL